MKRLISGAVLAAAVIALTGCSADSGTPAEEAPTFPLRSIEYTVPFGPGGGTDLISRKLAEVAGPILGQSINILNKPGASGTLGVSEVLQTKADGYTIGLSNNQGALFTPLTTSLPYQGADDFQPIIKLSELPCVLVVRADSEYETFEDFVAAGKSAPNTLSIAVAGKLTACDLAWQGQVAQEVKMEAIMAPFTGGAGEASTALLGGQVDAYLGDIIGVLPQIRAGEMRALVLFQDERHPLFEGVPSIVELGYANVMPIMYFVLGPKGLPEDVTNVLYEAFSEAIESDEFQSWAADNGYVLEPLGPADLRAELDDMRVEYEKIYDRLGRPRS